MTERRADRSLVATLARRIVLFAVAAMAVQFVIVFADYYFDDANLGELIVENATGGVADQLSRRDGRWQLDRPALEPDGVRLRVRTDDGEVIYSDCDADCGQYLPPVPDDPPDRWSRLLRQGKPIAVVGGRSVTVDGETFFVDVAVIDNGGAAMWRALGHELYDHLGVPMLLQLAFILGGALVSARLALRPLQAAARQAERVDPLDPEKRIDVTRLPREIAELGQAVNRALARIGGMMREQKLFTTAIAHEIRTPLAMLKLELGGIDHPRARRMEGDIDDLARFVGQITALGRLEAIGRSSFVPIDPGQLVRGVAASIGPFVYDRRHSIGVADEGGLPFSGDRGLIEDALVNLVSNAVLHTPLATPILLRSGPGREVAVIDEAGLYRPPAERPSPRPGAERTGIGLEVVRRIAALHGARLVIDVDPGRSTAMRIVFPEPRETL